MTYSRRQSNLLFALILMLLLAGCTVSLREEVPSGQAVQNTTSVESSVVQPDTSLQVEQAPAETQTEAEAVQQPTAEPVPEPTAEPAAEETVQQDAAQDLVEDQSQEAQQVEAAPQPTAEPTVDLSAGTNDGQYSVHIVRPRDTVGTIAQGYNVTIDDILAANPGIGNGYYIYVGQELTIPPAGTAAAAAVAAPAASAQGTGNYQSYYVQPGDTLGTIAQAYGYSIDELASYNNIFNIHQIDVGQEIRIPLR